MASQNGDQPDSDHDAQIRRMVDQVAAMKLRLEEQNKMLSCQQDRPMVLTTGRKLGTFSDKPTTDKDIGLDDWAMEMLSACEARKLSGVERARLLIEHLGGRARREIMARGADIRHSHTAIVEVLQRVFGGGDDLANAQHGFYSHKQGKTDDLITLSLDLNDLYERIVQIDSSFESKREAALKGQFAEAANDVDQQREIRRLAKERQELSFLDLRDTLVSWCGSNNSASKHNTTTKPKATALVEENAADLHEVIKEQQKQITELINALQQKPKDHNTCWNCGNVGHFKRDCPSFQSRMPKTKTHTTNQKLNY